MKTNDSSPVLVGEEFLSLVSHEIKNPLTSITGYASFVEDAVRKNDHASALECLQVVRTEAERILRLAEDLLDASSLRAGKFRLTIGDVNVGAIVSRIAGRYAAMARREIEVCAPPDFPTIRGDQCRITQVIENLVSNAIKYSPEGSKIRCCLEANELAVRISICNSGATIPAEKLSMLFKRFSRLRIDGDGNGRRKGTGLGLYITKQIVEAHGGTIHVVSRDGDGTTFVIMLPRESAVGQENAN